MTESGSSGVVPGEPIYFAGQFRTSRLTRTPDQASGRTGPTRLVLHHAIGNGVGVVVQDEAVDLTTGAVAEHPTHLQTGRGIETLNVDQMKTHIATLWPNR